LHLVSKLELVLASGNMVEEVVPESSMVKHSCWNKAKMEIIKAKKATQKEAYKAKKVANLVTIELVVAFKASKVPKGKVEDSIMPIYAKGIKKETISKRESSKGEGSKEVLHVVETIPFYFDSSNSMKERKKRTQNA
jgi:hypothetical protein